MYNVMFYHTSDKSPKLMSQHATIQEARTELKRKSQETFSTCRMTKVKGLDRYEYVSREFDRWGFAFYIEADNASLNARLKM
jgi:hypothetical protein